MVSKPFFKDPHVAQVGDTLVIIYFGTGPESTYGPDGKAIARNPGQVRFRVVLDAETEEEISFEQIKGSTGATTTSALPFSRSCRGSRAGQPTQHGGG